MQGRNLFLDSQLFALDFRSGFRRFREEHLEFRMRRANIIKTKYYCNIKFILEIEKIINLKN
jgi:hypothetical protein